jgi:hypothetical protein
MYKTKAYSAVAAADSNKRAMDRTLEGFRVTNFYIFLKETQRGNKNVISHLSGLSPVM